MEPKDVTTAINEAIAPLHDRIVDLENKLQDGDALDTTNKRIDDIEKALTAPGRNAGDIHLLERLKALEAWVKNTQDTAYRAGIKLPLL